MCRILRTFVFAGQAKAAGLTRSAHANNRRDHPVVLFTLLMLVLSLHGLSASGHFPPEHPAGTLRSLPGVVILHGTILIALTALIAGLWAAWRLIPWYAAVIAGGLAILAAPLVLQEFSDSFVDDHRSLLSFAGASLAFAIMLLLLATNRVVL